MCLNPNGGVNKFFTDWSKLVDIWLFPNDGKVFLAPRPELCKGPKTANQWLQKVKKYQCY